MVKLSEAVTNCILPNDECCYFVVFFFLVFKRNEYIGLRISEENIRFIVITKFHL